MRTALESHYPREGSPPGWHCQPSPLVLDHPGYGGTREFWLFLTLKAELYGNKSNNIELGGGGKEMI